MKNSSNKINKTKLKNKTEKNLHKKTLKTTNNKYRFLPSLILSICIILLLAGVGLGFNSYLERKLLRPQEYSNKQNTDSNKQQSGDSGNNTTQSSNEENSGTPTSNQGNTSNSTSSNSNSTSSTIPSSTSSSSSASPPAPTCSQSLIDTQVSYMNAIRTSKEQQLGSIHQSLIQRYGFGSPEYVSGRADAVNQLNQQISTHVAQSNATLSSYNCPLLNASTFYLY